jgi:hypothetical protein
MVYLPGMSRDRFIYLRSVTPKILIMAFNKFLLNNKCLFKDF